MGVKQLNSPGAFSRAIEKRWDETDPVTRTFVEAGDLVGDGSGGYSLDGVGTLVVNEGGVPSVSRLECSGSDFNCNFWLGDSILVASDPTPEQNVLQAPIRLKFSAGVRAVGAWIGACPRDPFDEAFFDQPLYGAMWVALVTEPTTWYLVNAAGRTGQVCAVGSPLTAPFVGARATGGDRIAEVRFDAALLSNQRYGQFALSELTVEL